MSKRAGRSRYTGERPGWGKKGFDYDEARHLAAYRYAAELVSKKDVLDAGCGEGFGTQILADVAHSVVGVDHSLTAVEACRRAWKQPNLTFQVLDLMSLGDFKDTFEVVLNFQVLEHIPHDVAFLEALRTRIRPGGTLLLTTPNRLKSFSENPFHLREYTPTELATLLQRVFRKVNLLGIHGNEKVIAFDRRREKSVKRILRLDPLGLRRKMPNWMIVSAFSMLSVLVRRQAHRPSQTNRIQPEDFSVREGNLDEALDLVALCTP